MRRAAACAAAARARAWLAPGGVGDGRDCCRARRRRGSSVLGRRGRGIGSVDGGPGVLPSPAARAPAFLFRGFVRTQHVFALRSIGVLEVFPPVDELDRDLSAVSAQPEKVVGGPEARMLEKPEWALTRTLLEARLHRPGFLDHGFQPARNRESFGLLLEHAVHRYEQRGCRPLALRLGRIPTRQDLMPEQGGEQERRRYRFSDAHALVGVLEREIDEALS